MGAHGLHRNGLTEALVCVPRLAPAQYNTQHSFTSLFPPPQEDPLATFFEDLGKRFKSGVESDFFGQVPRFDWA